MPLSDSELRKWSTLDLYHGGLPLITPFCEETQPEGQIGWGLTSAGYDVRLAPRARIFKNSFCETLRPDMFADPAFCAKVFDLIESDTEIVLPPHSYALVMAHEWVNMPRVLDGWCVGRSTYARMGIVVNTTPMEAGWRGNLTIEIANTSPCPVALAVMQGIAQFKFAPVVGDVERSYADRRGKYQDQDDVTPARMGRHPAEKRAARAEGGGWQ